MNKSKFLFVLVIAMLLINIVIISFTLSDHRPPFFGKGKEMPREIIIKKLGFDKKQIAAYDVLIDAHKKRIKWLNDSIRAKKNQLYSHLKNNTIQTKQNDSLISEIANYQIQIETTHFNHFIDIKKICNKEQLEKYNALTFELAQLFSPPKGPKNER
ncbi:hypothetical protein [Flavobacterium sp.]|uniref:hypothetical protein n=1 Tax=Flavobacterium sp. TaxID=239 RepID=UPI00262ECE79|nr:hypothetical protein [Flavobacterium sp.]